MLVQHHYQDKGKYSFTSDSIVASWTPMIEWLPRWLPQWKFQNLCHQGIVVRQYESRQHCYQGNTRSPSENGRHSKKVVAKLVVKVQITMEVCWTHKNKIKIQERKGERRMAEGTRWLQTFYFYSHSQRLKKIKKINHVKFERHRPPFSCVHPFCLKLLFVWCATHTQVNNGDKTRHPKKKKKKEG